MAKGINVFLIVSGRVIPMCQGERGLYYNDEGWPLCFHEQNMDKKRAIEINVYTESIAEISLYGSEFFTEMDEQVQELYFPIYLKTVNSCFEDKWGKKYVVL